MHLCAGACECPATKECVSSPGDLVIDVHQPPYPAGAGIHHDTPGMDHVAPSRVAPSSPSGGVPRLEHTVGLQVTLNYL